MWFKAQGSNSCRACHQQRQLIVRSAQQRLHVPQSALQPNHQLVRPLLLLHQGWQAAGLLLSMFEQPTLFSNSRSPCKPLWQRPPIPPGKHCSLMAVLAASSEGSAAAAPSNAALSPLHVQPLTRVRLVGQKPVQPSISVSSNASDSAIKQSFYGRSRLQAESRP